MAKYCMKCGIRMDDNDMVCPECGMQQGGYASPKEMQSIDGMRPQESNGKSVDEELSIKAMKPLEKMLELAK